MAKYKLTETGVRDTELGMSIPSSENNRHWRMYQAWLSEGNTPDPIQSHASAQELTKSEINRWREEALQSLKVNYDGNTFDADKRARDNITGIVSAINTGVPVPDPVNWRTADNITVALTHTDLTAISGLMLSSVQSIYEHSWDLKGQADSSIDQADLDSIQW